MGKLDGKAAIATANGIVKSLLRRGRFLECSHTPICGAHSWGLRMPHPNGLRQRPVDSVHPLTSRTLLTPRERGNRVMFRKALVVSAIIASIISAVGFSTPPIPAALPPTIAPVVRITEADGLMQKIALELRRCGGDYDDFDAHCGDRMADACGAAL